MQATYTITGNTYSIKDIIRNAGFAWDGHSWTGDKAAAERWEKITTPSWSRADANRVAKSGARVVMMREWSINDLMAPANSDY
jgi:hypothetical protein